MNYIRVKFNEKGRAITKKESDVYEIQDKPTKKNIRDFLKYMLLEDFVEDVSEEEPPLYEKLHNGDLVVIEFIDEIKYGKVREINSKNQIIVDTYENVGSLEMYDGVDCYKFNSEGKQLYPRLRKIKQLRLPSKEERQVFCEAGRKVTLYNTLNELLISRPDEPENIDDPYVYSHDFKPYVTNEMLESLINKVEELKSNYFSYN